MAGPSRTRKQGLHAQLPITVSALLWFFVVISPTHVKSSNRCCFPATGKDICIENSTCKSDDWCADSQENCEEHCNGHFCAASPPPLPPSPPLPPGSPILPADFVKRIGLGINLGNVLEAPVEGAWAPPATEALFDAYVAAGIRVVRIPMRWDNHTDTTAPYSIDPVWMARTQEVVSWSLKRGLITIINTHHDSWLDDPAAFESKLPRFVAIWKQIAAAYVDAPHLLAFEVFNEPHVMTVDQLNAMNTAVLPVIRRHHPTRVVFIGGLQFMNPTWILANPNAMHLFPNDSYVALEIHNYDPHKYAQPHPTQHTWGSNADKAALGAWMEAIATWAAARRLSIFYAEFGCTIAQTPETGRLEWYTQHRIQGLAHGFGMATWDDAGNFPLLNCTTYEWAAGIRTALGWKNVSASVVSL